MAIMLKEHLQTFNYFAEKYFATQTKNMSMRMLRYISQRNRRSFCLVEIRLKLLIAKS